MTPALRRTRRSVACAALACVLACAGAAVQAAAGASHTAAPASTALRTADGAEARLLEVYALIGQGRQAEALARAGQLARAWPTFQAAQLVHADLLALRLPPAGRRAVEQRLQAPGAAEALRSLRDESARRLEALRHRPAPGTVPAQLLAVPASSRYALAVDVSRSRMYVLRNTRQGLELAADYYVSLGKAGAGKRVEGDARTPLGVYHVTSNLPARTLPDFYGAGALPLNYPNAYDRRAGRTGSGIWLHGSPPEQYARAPLATDGCVVLADNDLRQLLRMADVGATVVTIAPRLDWIPQAEARVQAQALRRQVLAWNEARAEGDLQRWQSFYLPDAVRAGRLGQQRPALRDELAQTAGRGRAIELKDVSVLRWRDERQELMVVNFGEVPRGERAGALRRQYWLHAPGGWKIFHEEWL